MAEYITSLNNATVKKAASQELKKFEQGIVVNGLTVTINKTSRREFTRSNITKNLFKKSPEVFAQKMRAAASIDNIIVSKSFDCYYDDKIKSNLIINKTENSDHNMIYTHLGF